MESPEGHHAKKDVKESFSEDEDKMEDSPVLGLLTGHKTSKSEIDGSKGNSKKKAPSDSTIKSALVKRAPYIIANSEYVTLFLELLIILLRSVTLFYCPSLYILHICPFPFFL